ncbi:MAG TPA: c-type cytochrome [Cyclobacteriaceae bacterium]|nr:c-type cytochrome [Cyclobacteriaceae bacterium]
MKTIFSIFAIALILTACGSKEEKKTEKEDFGTPDNSSSAASGTNSDPIALGEALVKGSDCKTCHAKDTKLVGPAHMEVAKKYDFTEANVKLLAKKIIDGGQGVWGEIPMTAHVGLSQADAEKMARYVLSLDGEKEH